MNAVGGREFALLVACAAWPRSAARDADVRRASTAPGLDWSNFLAAVRRHRMAALALDGLRCAGVAPGAGVDPQLRDLARRDVQDALRMVAEAERIRVLFAAADLPMAVVKGPVLSMLAYGEVGLRQCRDLDVLVTPADAPRALGLLEAAGYRRLSPPPAAAGDRMALWYRVQKDVELRHVETGAAVELHHRLTLNPHLLRPLAPIDAVRRVEVAGVVLPTFGEADLFAYLCAHGAAHAWFRLKWLADVAALLVGRPVEDILRLYEAAEERGVARPAGQALLLCQRFWGLPLPGELAERLRVDRKVVWLERLALGALAGPPLHERRLAGTGLHLAQLALRDGWAFRWAQVAALLVDWPLVWAVALPKPLFFLYAVAKPPLWIWRTLGLPGGRRS
ncbi:MAG: nucleotidyltransferase family protein [Phenylobacterium sp.]